LEQVFRPHYNILLIEKINNTRSKTDEDWVYDFGTPPRMVYFLVRRFEFQVRISTCTYNEENLLYCMAMLIVGTLQQSYGDIAG
jgi:hypothetical protein